MYKLRIRYIANIETFFPCNKEAIRIIIFTLYILIIYIDLRSTRSNESRKAGSCRSTEAPPTRERLQPTSYYACFDMCIRCETRYPPFGGCTRIHNNTPWIIPTITKLQFSRVRYCDCIPADRWETSSWRISVKRPSSIAARLYRNWNRFRVDRLASIPREKSVEIIS